MEPEMTDEAIRDMIDTLDGDKTWSQERKDNNFNLFKAAFEEHNNNKPNPEPLEVKSTKDLNVQTVPKLVTANSTTPKADNQHLEMSAWISNPNPESLLQNLSSVMATEEETVLLPGEFSKMTVMPSWKKKPATVNLTDYYYGKQPHFIETIRGINEHMNSNYGHFNQSQKPLAIVKDGDRLMGPGPTGYASPSWDNPPDSSILGILTGLDGTPVKDDQGPTGPCGDPTGSPGPAALPGPPKYSAEMNKDEKIIFDPLIEDVKPRNPELDQPEESPTVLCKPGSTTYVPPVQAKLRKGRYLPREPKNPVNDAPALPVDVVVDPVPLDMAKLERAVSSANGNA